MIVSRRSPKRWVGAAGTLVIFVGLGLGVVGACGRGEPTPVPGQPVAGGQSVRTEQIGVPECDAYIARFRACLPDIPRSGRAPMEASFEMLVRAWKRTLEGNPTAGPELVKGCKEQEQALRESNPQCFES